jgi:hypothetical protein
VELSDDNVVNFQAIEIGSCPTCPEDKPSLLELFTFRPLQNPPMTVTLENTLDPNGLSTNSSSSEVWGYTRGCLPISECYNLTLSVPDTAGIRNSSYFEIVPTVVKLNGAYFGNADGVFDAQVDKYSYSFPVGSCTKENMCGADMSLLTVNINTSGATEYTPNFFCTWYVYVYETEISPLRPAPENWERFGRGYPRGSQFRSFTCVSNESSLSFGMINAVPLEVTWSIEVNGIPQTCSVEHQDIISTPFNGSCKSPLSAGSIVGIVFGALAAVILAMYLLWRHRKQRAIPLEAQEHRSSLENRADAADTSSSNGDSDLPVNVSL